MTDERTSRRRSAKRLWPLLAVLAIVAVVAVAVLVGAKAHLGGSFRKSSQSTVPSHEVRRGDFVDYVELRGEIAVGAASVIVAPRISGDLRILKLVPDGTRVKKGDAVVSFDPTALQGNANQYRAALQQAEAEVERIRAQQSLQEEQIRTDVVSAEFGLERARLDAGTRDVVPAIEYEKNLLAVAKAEQRKRELDARLSANRVAAEADLAGALRKRDKAKEDLAQVERDMTGLVLTAPEDGIIALMTNSQAQTSVLGDSRTVFKEGDMAWSGAVLAELPDMATIHASAPVHEADRGRIEVGQPVVLRIEAVPDRDHKGIVGEISTLASVDASSLPIIRKSFAMKIQLEQPDPRLRAGMTASIRVETERVPDAVVIPAEAVFDRGGRSVVYVLDGDHYRERQVRLARRNGNQAMVDSGLEPGERIATKEPTLSEDDD